MAVATTKLATATGSAQAVLVVAAVLAAVAVSVDGQTNGCHYIDPTAGRTCELAAGGAIPGLLGHCCAILSADRDNCLQCQLRELLAGREQPLTEIFPCIAEEAACLRAGPTDDRPLLLAAGV